MTQKLIGNSNQYNHDDLNDISNIFKKKKLFKKFISDSKFVEVKAMKNF